MFVCLACVSAHASPWLDEVPRTPRETRKLAELQRLKASARTSFDTTLAITDVCGSGLDAKTLTLVCKLVRSWLLTKARTLQRRKAQLAALLRSPALHLQNTDLNEENVVPPPLSSVSSVELVQQVKPEDEAEEMAWDAALDEAAIQKRTPVPGNATSPADVQAFFHNLAQVNSHFQEQVIEPVDASGEGEAVEGARGEVL